MCDPSLATGTLVRLTRSSSNRLEESDPARPMWITGITAASPGSFTAGPQSTRIAGLLMDIPSAISAARWASSHRGPEESNEVYTDRSIHTRLHGRRSEVVTSIMFHDSDARVAESITAAFTNT